MCYLVDTHGGTQQQIFCFREHLLLDMLLGRKTCHTAHKVAEIVDGQAELAGAILHGEKSIGLRSLTLIIVIAQLLEACQHVIICHRCSLKLAVVGMEAIVEHQLDVVGDDKQVGLSCLQFLVYLAEDVEEQLFLTLRWESASLVLYEK